MYHSCATNSNKFICWGQINKERISIPDIFKSGAAVLTSGLNHTCATIKNTSNNTNTNNQSQIDKADSNGTTMCWGKQ